jgi:hypothetical protein
MKSPTENDSTKIVGASKWDLCEEVQTDSEGIDTETEVDNPKKSHPHSALSPNRRPAVAEMGRALLKIALANRVC